MTCHYQADLVIGIVVFVAMGQIILLFNQINLTDTCHQLADRSVENLQRRALQ